MAKFVKRTPDGTLCASPTHYSPTYTYEVLGEDETRTEIQVIGRMTAEASVKSISGNASVPGLEINDVLISAKNRAYNDFTENCANYYKKDFLDGLVNKAIEEELRQHDLDPDIEPWCEECYADAFQEWLRVDSPEFCVDVEGLILDDKFRVAIKAFVDKKVDELDHPRSAYAIQVNYTITGAKEVWVIADSSYSAEQYIENEVRNLADDLGIELPDYDSNIEFECNGCNREMEMEDSSPETEERWCDDRDTAYIAPIGY